LFSHWHEPEIGLINDPYLWQITGLIILVAVVESSLKRAGCKICRSELSDSFNHPLVR
jgi:hypothetical protein